MPFNQEGLEPNFYPVKLFNNKQNGDWREVSVESLGSLSNDDDDV